MLKNILESINETLSFITVTSGTALSLWGILILGADCIILLAVCSFILSAGLTITLKLMNKNKEKED